jgi:hypothetical protein
VFGLFSPRGFAMKCSIVLAALAAAVTVAACGSSTSTPASGAPAPSGAAQFGGDPCTALTRAEVEAATYPQGTAVFDSNDRQKDAGTRLPVVCQWQRIFRQSSKNLCDTHQAAAVVWAGVGVGAS